MAGLGALRQLDLDHLDLRVARRGGKFLSVERAIGVAAAEITAADLPDDIAAMDAVMRRKSALAGVMRKATHLRALVQRADGVGGQRAETHGGDIEQRQRVRLDASRPADHHTEIKRRRRRGRDRVGQPLIVAAIDIDLRAERPLVELALGALVDDGPRRTVERHAVEIAFEKILPDFGANFFEQKAQIGENGVIAQQRMSCLDEIVEAKQRKGAENQDRRLRPGAHQRLRPGKGESGKDRPGDGNNERGKPHGQTPA